MRPLVTVVFMAVIASLSAQDVGIGTVNNPTNLVMNQGVIVLDSKNDSIAGAIKFDGGVFYGFNGTSWVSLSPPPPKKILGYSTTTSRGRFSYSGKFGIAAADQMCKDSYPNSPTARVYFSQDINEALANDLVEGTTDNARFWAFNHGHEGFNSFDFDSRRNNCWCFSFNSGDIADGTVGVINTNTMTGGNGGGITVNQVSYLVGISCTSQYPVLCGE